ncbi:hypothetical protein DPMN_000036 [Dreissena polymorpha]|uniref:Uncharacterized protein n=1 Tax=Dreissena polymorpha TaxID=45954 RepID=A0A9D4MF31_DREPO|nr:hypothetical protein DPMN_000036 [Dreissena polymorpha]
MAWQRPTRAPLVEIDRIVIRKRERRWRKNGVTWYNYQLEVNRCRNEEIIVKDNLGGCGLCGRGAPVLIMAPRIVEIDCIVIREVQYQFEVNRCRNEDTIVKGNFGWA